MVMVAGVDVVVGAVVIIVVALRMGSCSFTNDLEPYTCVANASADHYKTNVVRGDA